jgi:hypothetical protein
VVGQVINAAAIRLDDEYIPIVCSIGGKNYAWSWFCWFAIPKGWGLIGTADQQSDYSWQDEGQEKLDC